MRAAVSQAIAAARHALPVALLLWASAAVGAQPVQTERIITLGAAITETVFALGAGAQVVGVDASSTYPAAVRRLPQLGYFRQVAAEGLLALRPTLVLANAETAPATLAQLRSARVRVELLPVGDSEAAALARIVRIGVLVGRPHTADSVANHVRTGVARARAAAQRRPSRTRALFIYARGMGTLFVAGRNSGADAMLQLAGATNAVTQFEGYKLFTAEAIATSGAEVIVLPDAGLESLGGIDALLKLPGLAQTPAGRNRRVVTVADDLLLSFGPRLPEAIAALTRAIDGVAPRAAEEQLPATRR